MSNADSKTGAIILLTAGAALSVLLLGALREPLARMWDDAQTGSNELKQKNLRRYDADQVVTRVLPEALEFSDVYVPVETELSFGADEAVEFRPTLSIRNRSDDEALYVAAVHLFGTDGQVQRSYLKHTLEVAPFASIQFELAERSITPNEDQAASNEEHPRPQCLPEEKGVDPCAAPASHFVVTWGATKKMRAPLIETIMVDQEGRVSHIREAEPMKRPTQPATPVSRRRVATPALPPLAANLAPLPRETPRRPTPRTSEPEYELIRYDSDYGLRSRGL